MNARLARKNREVNPESFERLYGKLVDELVGRRYSIAAQIAILRQRDTKPEEFRIFNEYVENCKVEAKQMLGV